MSDLQRQAVYLAGLLHDIGKFYQRADSNSSQQFSNDLKSTFCPYHDQKGFYSHVHVLWTSRFIEENKEIFKLVLTDEYELFYKAAVAHHKPNENNVLQKVVQKADHYSSGVDRQSHESAEKDAEDERKWDSFKKKRMYSIFENLLKEEEAYEYRLPISALSIEEGASFPKGKDNFEQTGDQEYADLWLDFEKEFKNLPGDAFEALFESLMYLLEKYTHAIPSSTMHLPDVSLFDHLKSTAAISVCIYDYLKEKNGLKKAVISDEESPILLVGGDLSGIQSFIYDVVSTNAAKNLKGRSFYLQMLVDNILQQLLEKLQLNNSHVIYASGGGFYMLVPNTNFHRKAIEEFTNEIEHKIFEQHKTTLYLAIGFEEVTQKAIMCQEINEVWMNLSQKLNEQKRQRYAKMLTTDEGYKLFFQPSEMGGEQNKDVITNEEIHENEAVEYLDKDEDEPQMPVKRETTYQQIRLGKQLKKTDYWINSHQEITHWKDQPFRSLSGSFYNYFISKETLYQNRLRLAGSADRIKIRALNQTGFLSKDISGNDNIYGFTFYGGNDYPIGEDETPLSFDKLAGEDGEGFKRLGILRMDMDNLGNIFKSGFNNERRTFSRYATLSRNLDFFFKGYLNTIWNKSEEYRTGTYILYSGGDDLFIVGKWDVLIKLAKDIRNAFKQWTCRNPHLSLSGGIAIVPSKFPIAKGASMAELAENQAKAHIYQDHEKNAFSLLNHALNWDYEFPLVEKLKDKLVKLIDEDEVLPKGILQRIMAFHEQAKQQQEENENESWRWQMAYHFARAAETTKKEAGRNFLSEIQIGIFTDNNQYAHEASYKKSSNSNFFDLLNIASRWAELEIRNI